MKDQDSHTGEDQNSGKPKWTYSCSRCCRERYHALSGTCHRGPAETINGNNENPKRDGSYAVESSTHYGRRPQVRVSQCKREHNAKGGKHETESRKQTAPPTAPRIPEKDTELRSRGPRQHVDQRKALDEALLGDPLPLVLEFRLHDSPRRESTVRSETQL